MTAVSTGKPEMFLWKFEVMKKASLASQTIDYFIEKGDFPKPYEVFEEKEMWKLSDVMAWVCSRYQAAEALRNGQRF